MKPTDTEALMQNNLFSQNRREFLRVGVGGLGCSMAVSYTHLTLPTTPYV